MTQNMAKNRPSALSRSLPPVPEALASSASSSPASRRPCWRDIACSARMEACCTCRMVREKSVETTTGSTPRIALKAQHRLAFALAAGRRQTKRQKARHSVKKPASPLTPSGHGILPSHSSSGASGGGPCGPSMGENASPFRHTLCRKSWYQRFSKALLYEVRVRVRVRVRGSRLGGQG